MSTPESSKDSPHSSTGDLPQIAPTPPAPAQRSQANWKIVDPKEENWNGQIPRARLGLGDDFTYRNNYQRSAHGLANWMIVAATRRGRSHAHEGSFREDAFDLKVADNIAVYAACDGAGSSKLSRIGSEFSARRITEEMIKSLTPLRSSWVANPEKKKEDIGRKLHDAVAAVSTELQCIARDFQAEPKDFRCTLLLLIHLIEGLKEEFWFGQVGDGFIGAGSSQNAERWGLSDSGEFSGQVGCFIPDVEAAIHARDSVGYRDGADLREIMIATDGIEDPFFPVQKNLESIFKQLRGGVTGPLEDFYYTKNPGAVMVSPATSETELAEWLSFEKRGENDDRTVILLYREQEAK